MTETTADGAAETPSLRKDALRRLALARRDALSLAARARAAERLVELIGGLDLPAAAVVAGFWPIRSEIDPRPALEMLAARGHALALPVVLADRRVMIFRRWRPGEALIAAPFGLSEPGIDAAEVDPDVLLMPLAAFDRRGQRIGYGGGYYDRALERLERTTAPLKIGLAHGVQEIERVPDEPHDRRLDLILTEAGVIVPSGDPT